MNSFLNVRLLAALILLTAATFIIKVAYDLGAFAKVEISQGESPEMWLLYQEFTGPYDKILPALEEVEAWAKGQSIPCPKTFGEFIDNPEDVKDQTKLRSRVGCILETPATITSDKFKIEKKSPHQAVLANFTGSPGIGPTKVYPEVQKFMQEKKLKQNWPVTEIYTILKKGIKTEYIFPL